jgi:hypothetical protein
MRMEKRVMILALSIIESSAYGGDEDEDEDDDPTVPPS